ncbi:hypothetical protein [Emticicia fontis]
MGIVKTGLVLGGIGYALAELNKQKTPTLQKSLAATQQSTLDTAAVVKAIQQNPDLLALVRGPQGPAGATGATGAAGAAGIAGDQYRTFAGSLVKNGAAELGTAEGWADGVIGAVHEGMLSLDFIVTASKNCLNSNQFHIDNRRLIKITCSAKVSAGNYGFYLKRLDKDGVAINQNSQANIFPLNTINYSNTGWETKTAYFGGIATNIQTAIGINTAKAQVSLYLSAAGTLSISHLCVQHVSLGEPVPFNLAYLPQWQSVYDPTTGDTGIYNGTAVVWAS